MPSERFYVTTPIYYVNSTPHPGQAYTTVLADVLAGYHRLLGVPTFFLTGTDEHGEKAELAAAARGIPPQQLCDEYAAVYRDLFERLGIRYDDFIRTTQERHRRIAVRVLEKLWAQGDLYKADYEGWYCTRCETFFTETDVQAAGGACPDQPVLHGAIKRVSESNYFFRTSKYAPEVRRRLEAGEVRFFPANRVNEVLGLLRQDVQDLCISRHRSRVSWGIPLPFDAEYICYVWIDALFNYKSAIGYLDDDAARRANHAAWWSEATHVLGKDILKHHSLIWHSLLLAVGEPLPRRMYVHGWLLDASGLKVSKSKLAVSPDEALPMPDELIAAVGRDATRYVLATAMKPGDDAQFTWRIARDRYDSELANGLGNSVNRVVRMAHQFAGGRMPALGAGGPRGERLRVAALAALDAVRAVPDTLDVLSVTQAVRAAVDEMSQYLDEEKPWKAAKDPANAERVAGVLGDCLEALRIFGLALTPILPERMAALRATLGQPAAPDFASEAVWGALGGGTPLGEPPGLFPRFDDSNMPQREPATRAAEPRAARGSRGEASQGAAQP